MAAGTVSTQVNRVPRAVFKGRELSWTLKHVLAELAVIAVRTPRFARLRPVGFPRYVPRASYSRVVKFRFVGFPDFDVNCANDLLLFLRAKFAVLPQLIVFAANQFVLNAGLHQTIASPIIGACSSSQRFLGTMTCQLSKEKRISGRVIRIGHHQMVFWPPGRVSRNTFSSFGNWWYSPASSAHRG